jgi:hypothetical protein
LVLARIDGLRRLVTAFSLIAPLSVIALERIVLSCAIAALCLDTFAFALFSAIASLNVATPALLVILLDIANPF